MQVVPFSDEFEKAVIVSVLQDPRLLPRISAFLAPEDFYKERHREIYKVMVGIEMDNLDSLTVQDKLKGETEQYFKDLVADSDRIIPSTSNAMFYAETIKSKAKLRSGIDLGQQIIATCYAEQDAEEAIHELEDMFASFLQKRVLENKVESSREAFKKFIESLQKREPSDPNAVRTGFVELDLMIQRLEGLVVLAARPGMGKTALAANIIANVARAGHNVLFFSLEQERSQIFERMLAAEAESSLEEIRIGAINNDEVALGKIQRGEEVMEHLMEYIHIDDKANINTAYITSVSRQKAYEKGSLGLIVIDYLNIMRLADKMKVEALGDAVKELRALGKELGVPVLLLAQLSRQPEGQDRKKNRRPELSDLRDSGEIEQSADMVWFIYRDSYYDQAGLVPSQDIAEVIVRKNRNGRQGIVNLEWYPEIQKFRDVLRGRK